ncbi:hypothetical protein OROGR_019105 [Orobanche gracilis]
MATTSSNMSGSPIADVESFAAAAAASDDVAMPPMLPLPLLLPPTLPPPPVPVLLPETRAVWKRPNMRGSKCSINGYVRLGIVKTIIVELSSVGKDIIREFRESCLGHFIREEWGGFVYNAALHALFSNELVRPDAQVDEFWFSIGRRLIRFSRFEYALVTVMRFGDSDFDIHGDDVHIEGSVYDRYPILISRGQMLDPIRDRFATRYFRQQSGDALKEAHCLPVVVDAGRGPDSMGELSMGGYSYQILVTYLREVSTEVPTGLDPSYHFYGNIYAIMIWACGAIPSLGSKCGTILRDSFIQQPRCTRWKLKKLGHVAFTTFFDDQIDCFEVLSSTHEEEQESYMLSICDDASKRVPYTHRMSLFKKGVVGRRKGKGKGRARDEPHEHVHTDSQRRSSPIRGPHQTTSSSARGIEEIAPIADLDTLFTQLRQYIDSTAQQIYRYIDNVGVRQSRRVLSRGCGFEEHNTGSARRMMKEIDTNHQKTACMAIFCWLTLFTSLVNPLRKGFTACDILERIWGVTDNTAQETRRHIDNTTHETRRRMEELFVTTQWDFRDIDEFMRSSPHDGSVSTGPRVAQTESIPTADVDRASH